MQSIIQKRSCNSVQIFWLNRDLLRERLLECVKELVTKRPEVQKVVLFGSVAESREAVSSDVDILLVVKESPERFIDRSIRFRDFFKHLELGVDIFAYTRQELGKGNIPLAEVAIRKGKILFERNLNE